MSDQPIQELIPFNTACDEFITGKYILSEMKISSILKLISADDKLKNIISSCLDNFDFVNALEKCTIETPEETSLVLPKDEKQLVAFVFSLLYRFDAKMLDFLGFISKYFKADDENASKQFDAFAKTIIAPFKDAINNLFSRRYVIASTDDYQENYYNKIKATIKLILREIDSFKLKLNQKEEFNMLLNSLYFSAEKNDKKMVYSLMIGLDYFSKANKHTRNAYLSLEECFGR